MSRKEVMNAADRMPSQEGLKRFVKHSAVGDRYAYHIGDLAADRLSDRAVGALAAEAFRLAEAGMVVLVQRRVGGSAFAYYVERRS